MSEMRPQRTVAPGLLVLFFLLQLSHGWTVAASRKYNTGATPVPGKLNVHLVPHTHDDLGWLHTADQYYIGPDATNTDSIAQISAVQYILHDVVQELQDDPNRKFSYVETGFFVRWWREQSAAKQAIVKQLVASRQLEFINGGWCMHDEGAAHYVDMIDQTTLGHRYLKNYFGIVPRHGWQIDPFGHSAVQAYLLGAEAGFDSIFVARIDYQDKKIRKVNKTLEMIWRGSETFGASSQVFMGVFPVHYNPPSTFEFETSNTDYVPVQDDLNLHGYNIDQRVNDLVQAAQEQAAVTRTNHIMWTMGDDFTYQTASTWFSPMDKLIHYANIDGRVNVLYSSPSIYLNSKHSANETWPLKTGDFFPYADTPEKYWTGYFTSRPALKGYIRMLSGYLQAARQLEFLVGRQEKGGFTTDSLEEAMATAQHHDAVSGTSTQAVTDDYIQRLYVGAQESTRVIDDAMEFFTGRSSNGTFQQCGLLNVSYCPASEASVESNGTLVVVAYNSLAWARIEYIRIPVSTEDLTVKESNGNVIVSQIVPVSNVTKNVRDFYVAANLGVQVPVGPLFHLVFQASVPPLGFTSFIIEPSALGPATGAAEKSTVEATTLTDNNTGVQIGSGVLDLTFSSTSGHLVNMFNNRSRSTLSVTQTNLWYKGADGSENDSQSSGAYIFLPDGSTARPVNNASTADLVSNTVVRGPLVEEIRQVFSPWVSQVMRVYKGQEHVEVEFTIGPIPVDDGIGKEVITRISTSIASDKTFYTDSNGRDFIQRVRDHRDSWPLTVVQPIAGNYYPITLGMYVTDDQTDFSVLVDRSVGGASIVDGQVEVMLHRRLVADDGAGVGQDLNETVCLSDGDSCEGLTIQGRYLFSSQPKSDAAKWRRTQGQSILSPLVLAFTTKASNDSSGTGEASRSQEFSAMAPNTSLPANVALLTLQELETGQVLLRLAHLYEANEHPELSKLATIDLKDLFSGYQIVNCTEMSLTANQAKSDMKKLDWSVEGDQGGSNNKSHLPLRGAPFQFSSLQVELGPMEIRTFLVSVKDRSKLNP